MNRREVRREHQNRHIDREELIERMMRLLPEDGTLEAFPGFFIFRLSAATESVFSLAASAFCVIAQGSKEVVLGGEIFRYDPGHYLISTVDLPTVSRVVEATAEKPYLGLRLNLDPAFVGPVIIESGIETKKGDADAMAMNVNEINADLLDAVIRLVRLVDSPRDFKALSPLIIKEIVFRLLLGGQNARLSHLSASEGHTRRISRAVKQLREHFDEPLKIEDVAREVGMSVSGFHHHFKSVTATSPVQFQKQIRLQEARRLMLGEDLDAASAGFRVGYEDPSYFSRDYKKLFGAPPQRDIAKLRSNLEV